MKYSTNLALNYHNIDGLTIKIDAGEPEMSSFLLVANVASIF